MIKDNEKLSNKQAVKAMRFLILCIASLLIGIGLNNAYLGLGVFLSMMVLHK